MSQELERRVAQAIVALQAANDLPPGPRQVLLRVLQDKLAAIRQPDAAPVAQRKQVTVLFATVSGFTRLVESLHDTNMLDLVNLLWGQLDQAIKEQGGLVDKHMGDGVMGIFGVPSAREDDPVRAIRAALAMQAALNAFLQEMQTIPEASVRTRDESMEGLYRRLQALTIRIGVNTGPALLGRVGTRDEYTVIGDTVNVGRRLEQAAAPGAILIAQETHALVKGLVDSESVGPVPIRGRSEPVAAFLVRGARPPAIFPGGRGVEGVETRLVGRDTEMARLQTLVEVAWRQRRGHLLTVVGEAGVGKSRLIVEFATWLQGQLTEGVTLMRGRADAGLRPAPFSLLRDVFTTYFGIQDNERVVVAEEKFVQGMRRFLSQGEEDLRRRARLMGQLVGLGASESGPSTWPEARPLHIRERGFRYVTGFFAAVAAASSLTVLILEDIHWADEGSRELVRHLSRLCRREPLLIICLARPSLFELDPGWLVDAAVSGGAAGGNPDTDAGDDAVAVHSVMALAPLPDAASRALVLDILRKLPQIPASLADLVVSRAEGNPFYVEEMIKVLIEDGHIVPDEGAWRLGPQRLRGVRIPSTLTSVLQSRLDRLSPVERTTLLKAAVVGRVFWDESVSQMSDPSGQKAGEQETAAALAALERRELIFRRPTSLFAGTQAFNFKHAILRDVAYESVLLRHRTVYHRQVAEWLVDQSGERVAEYASGIAEHYELAGEGLAAARMYELAAEQAQERYAPQLATDYYRKVLELMSDHVELAADLLRVQEKLGRLLSMQARLVEASQTYMMMQHTGELDGDLDAQARACNALAAIDHMQGRYRSMLRHAMEAEQIAWLVNAELELVQALLHRGQALLQLGQVADAGQVAERAVALSQELSAAQKVASGRALLVSVFLRQAEPGRAGDVVVQLAAQAAALAAEASQRRDLAYVQAMLGRIYSDMGRLEPAMDALQAALQTYRSLDYQLAVGQTLDALAETKRRTGRAEEAVSLHEEALAVAASVGDRYGALRYRSGLAWDLLQLAQYESAAAALRQVVTQSEDYAHVVSWRGLAGAYLCLAEAELGRQDVAAGRQAALQAYRLATATGNSLHLSSAWRILGVAAAQGRGTVQVQGEQLDAVSCFERSLAVLGETYPSPWQVTRARIRALRAWGRHVDDTDEAGRRQREDELQQHQQAAGVVVPETPAG